MLFELRGCQPLWEGLSTQREVQPLVKYAWRARPSADSTKSSFRVLFAGSPSRAILTALHHMCLIAADHEDVQVAGSATGAAAWLG